MRRNYLQNRVVLKIAYLGFRVRVVNIPVDILSP